VRTWPYTGVISLALLLFPAAPPLHAQSGTVEEIIPDKGKVRVQVSLFGRPTSVELDYTQLKGY